jgi:hypothetical protein
VSARHGLSVKIYPRSRSVTVEQQPAAAKVGRHDLVLVGKEYEKPRKLEKGNTNVMTVTNREKLVL